MASSSSSAAASPTESIRLTKMRQAFAASLKAWRSSVDPDVLQTAFPSLHAKHADSLDEMLNSFWENVDAFSQV